MQLATTTEVASILAKKRKLKANDSSDNIKKLTKKQRRKIKQDEDASEADEDVMDLGHERQQDDDEEEEDSNQLAMFE